MISPPKPLTLNWPGDKPPIRCAGLPSKKMPSGGCTNPAIAFYEWENSAFGNVVIRRRAMCAECSQRTANLIRMFTPPDAGEPIFYKPNKNLHISVLINYSAPPTQPEPPHHESPHEQRRVAPGTMQALVRSSMHTPHIMSGILDEPKGNPKLKFMVNVLCKGCGITYAAVRVKKCPNCGTPNDPQDPKQPKPIIRRRPKGGDQG